MAKRKAAIEKIRVLLPQFIFPHAPDHPLTIAEAGKRLSETDYQAYLRLVPYLGPLFVDEETHIVHPLKITGNPPDVIQRYVEANRRQQEKVAKTVQRRIAGDLPPFRKALDQLKAGDPTRLFSLVPLFGPLLLEVREVRKAIGGWFRLKDDINAEGHPSEVARHARDNLITLGKCLAHVGSGKIPLPEEKARANKKKNDSEADERRKKQQVVNRLVEKIEEEVQEEMQYRKTPQPTAYRKAFNHVLCLWQKTTPIRNEEKRNCIIKKVKKILFPTCQRES